MKRGDIISCQNNANAASSAAGPSGVSKSSNKMAYLVGATGGGAIGTLAGAPLGPLGMVGGGLVGSALGIRLTSRRLQARARKEQERRWLNSPAGKEAVTKREQQLTEARQPYRETMAKLKLQTDKVERAYDYARADFLNRQSKPQTAAKAGGLVAAGATAGAALKLAQGMAWTGRKPTAEDVKLVGVGAALGAAATAKTAWTTLKEKQWQESLEGQAATTSYKSGKTKIKLAAARAREGYQKKKLKIENQYEQARAEFFGNS